MNKSEFDTQTNPVAANVIAGLVSIGITPEIIEGVEEEINQASIDSRSIITGVSISKTNGLGCTSLLRHVLNIG